MFLGHYGLALAAKRASPRTSLGTLAFSAQFLDELWPVLLLTGVERVRIAPGFMSASSLEFVWYPWSHSLLMAAVWAACIGAAYRIWVRNPRGAWTVAALVLSHWFRISRCTRPICPSGPARPSSSAVGSGAPSASPYWW